MRFQSPDALEATARVIEPDQPKTNGHARPKSRDRFDVIDVDDIDIAAEPPWLVDNIMPATGLAVVYGLPKSGKSFLVADLAFHVSIGALWAGRGVLQGSVVYCAGEGVTGFKRRLVAFRKHYGVEGKGAPFGLIPMAPNLGREDGDDLKMIDTVRDWVAGKPPLRAIVIDTLSRAVRGADENTAKDMGIFVDNCERLGREFGCIVIVVHHAGKDAEKGARGSIALPAACDVMWYVEKGEAANQATIVSMKDGEDGLSWRFKLIPYDWEFNGAQQSATTTCIVEILDEPQAAQQSATVRNRKLKDGQTILLRIIKEATAEVGEFVKGDLAVPYHARAVYRSTLKNYLKPKGYWDDERTDAHNRVELSRDLKALAARGIIGLTSDHLWLTGKE
jgi:hypothetical protein